MTDEFEEERPREGAPNPTQERIDREGASERPADVAWDEDRWGDRSEGETTSGEPENRP